MERDERADSGQQTHTNYLSNARAEQIYAQVTSASGGTVDMHALNKFVKGHVTHVDALAGKEKLFGDLKESDKKLLDSLRGELGKEIVQVIKQVLVHEDEKLNPTQVKELSRLGATALAASSSGDDGSGESAGSRDFYDKYGFPRPEFEQQRLRSDIRVARSMKNAGTLGEDYAGLKSEMVSQLERHSEKLVEGYEQEKNKEGGGDTKTLDDFSRKITSTDRMRQEIVNLFDIGTSKQRSAYNVLLGTVGTILSTVGVQAVSRFAISEPYKFGTQPSLQIMGQQGQMGAAMGSAFGELEANNVELNQMSLVAGVTGAISGIGVANASGGNLVTKLLGGALAVGGVALGAAGALGYGDDFLRKVGFSTDEDQILGQALAKQFSDPSRLLNEFQVSRAGLLAVGAGSSYNMGFQTEGTRGEGLTGNTYLDAMLSDRMTLRDEEGNETEDVSTLRALGYNRESLGALLSQSALSLRDTGPGLTEMAAYAGKVGGLYGIGDEAAVSAMQTAQRFGSTDAIQTYKEYAGVFAEADGGISSYSYDVLVPALLKVTESMAVRNLARTTEELTGEVTTFGRTVIESGTRLGELAKANPEIIGRLLGGLQATASMGMDDPAMAALDMSLGSSMADIFLGRAGVADRRMQFVLNQAGLAGKEFGSVDEFLGSMQGIGVARVLQGITTGLSPQDLIALTEMAMQGTLLDEQGALDLDNFADQDLAQRVRDAGSSPLAGMSSKMSEQVDEFMTISSGLIDNLMELQSSITGFLGNPAISAIMSDFILKSAGEVTKLGEKFSEGSTGEDSHISDVEGVSSLREQLRSLEERGIDPKIGSAAAAWLDPRERTPLLERLEKDENFSNWFTGEFSTRFGEEGVGGHNWEEFEGLALEGLEREVGSHSTGGFTGMGGRHQPVGMVHAGEYVISSNNVANNIQILDRIQSGETVSEASVSQSQGNVTYLTMKIHGMSPEDIQNTARRVTEDYIVRNRLNYV